MASFYYKAIDADGQLVTGQLEAESVEHASTLLQARRLAAYSITREVLEMPAQPDDVLAQRLSSFDRPAPFASQSSDQHVAETLLHSHLTPVLERGRQIVPALRAYASEMPSGWQRRQLLAVCRVLERGDPSEAAKALVDLPEFWIPLLSAATTAGDPGQVLHEYLNESRRADILRQQWWLTLAYPVVLLCLATAVTTALAVIVIPEFRAIFSEFHVELPQFTLWLLGISKFMSNWGIFILIILLVLFAIMLLNANRLSPASALVRLTGRFRPPIGHRTSVARFARFTADLLEAGVKIPDAIRIAGFTVNRRSIRRAAWQLASEIDKTGGFAQPTYQRPLTASVTHALAAEMPPESRVQLLREISNAHADSTRINLSWATGVVEPVAIFVVGIVVGSTVIGLFLPLVRLVEGLTN